MPRTIITTTIESEDTIATPETVQETVDVNQDGDINDLVSTLEEDTVQPESPTGGFGLSFTPSKTYDLDAIIQSIDRTNSDFGINVRVNPENTISVIAYAAIRDEILTEYSATSEDEVLNYNEIFKTKLVDFDDYVDSVSQMEFVYYPHSEDLVTSLTATGATFEIIGDYIKQTLTVADLEGQLLLDEKQEKVSINRANLKKYLFDEVKSTDKVKPILNYAKAMTQWTELGDGDMTISEDFDTLELLEARIAVLQERINEL